MSRRIGEIISLDGESDQKISSFQNIPNEFFEDMESSWKGRVKRIHLEEAFGEVENAAQALSLAVRFVIFLSFVITLGTSLCYLICTMATSFFFFFPSPFMYVY